jgi:alcohol dehydrogenase class IV
MTTFTHFSPSQILFGRGTLAQLPALAAPLGARAALVHNGPPPDKVLALLQSANIQTTLIRQKGEPTIHHIDAALASAHADNCSFVIGLGGGSAIDAAKALAGLLTNPGTALDYLEVVGKGQKITRPAAPWIAIPTTAGTGAEATRNAVLGVPEKHFKASLRSELLLPRVALIDPELAINVPPHVTASSGMDALCQCIEAYTSTGATPLTDALAIEGITRAARSLKRAFDNPADLDAREDMALAALLSGIALTNAGLGAVHGFAAPLGAAFPVPHGTVCAALLPHVLLANISAFVNADREHDPVMLKYLKIAEIFLKGDAHCGRKWEAVFQFPQDLAQQLSIPRLSTFGITAESIPSIVTLAQKASSMKFNPIQLAPETLTQILQSAL